jgi:protein TonB
MTIPFSLDAFDHAQPVRRLSLPVDRAKLVSIALTIAFHIVILGAALTAVQVARPRAPQELSVTITPEKPKPQNDLAPPPRLVQPATVNVPMPEVAIPAAMPPPLATRPPVATPAPAPVAAQPTPFAGEGHDAFLGRLLDQLNRFKQYPRAARQAHIQGVVMLHFIMDADGKVLSFEIAKSSGRPVLDAEALALIQRAQPLPALPAGYPTRTLDAIVPIAFSLDR